MGEAHTEDKSSSMMAKMVRAIRNEQQISQEDLARDLGVSFATVNRWENDKAIPSRLAMSKIDAYCKEKKIKQDNSNILKF